MSTFRIALRHPLVEMAGKAVKTVADMVQKKELDQTHVCFDPELVVRESA